LVIAFASVFGCGTPPVFTVGGVPHPNRRRGIIVYCTTSEIMGTPATAPVLATREDKRHTDEFMALGFDASEPVYYIGSPKFGMSDTLGAQVANQKFQPKPCMVKLPGNVNRLLLVDVVELMPIPRGSWRAGHPHFRVEGWMFPEGFNPATDTFTRVRMLMSMMQDAERISSVNLQQVSTKPDRRKRSRITLVQRTTEEVLKDFSRQS
jgi:hypothetical protein